MSLHISEIDHSAIAKTAIYNVDEQQKIVDIHKKLLACQNPSGWVKAFSVIQKAIESRYLSPIKEFQYAYHAAPKEAKQPEQISDVMPMYSGDLDKGSTFYASSDASGSLLQQIPEIKETFVTPVDYRYPFLG